MARHPWARRGESSSWARLDGPGEEPVGLIREHVELESRREHQQRLDGQRPSCQRQQPIRGSRGRGHGARLYAVSEGAPQCSCVVQGSGGCAYPFGERITASSSKVSGPDGTNDPWILLPSLPWAMNVPEPSAPPRKGPIQVTVEVTKVKRPNTTPAPVRMLMFPLRTAVMLPSRSPVMAVTSTAPRKWSTSPLTHSRDGDVVETVVSVKLTCVWDAR